MTGTGPWWREAVTYEVYLRSFADADGDGLGDLAGARSRLPYLAGLGVDAVWLTPFYPSPDHDGGYDVSDHRAVDPRMGTLAELDGLIADAHRLGLRVVVDLVLNHVSSAHPWFTAARVAGPGSPERDRFHVRPGRGVAGELPPNGWRSIFGGPAWAPFGDGDWYLHLFDAEQPDLRHEHPEVAADAAATLRFWLDRGVDGVRFDAAGSLVKDPAYPELPVGWRAGDPSPYSDRDEVHEIYRRWARQLAAYPGDRLGVAETWGGPEVIGPYLRPDELGQAFAMDPLYWPLRPEDWQAGVDALLAATTRHGRLPAWVHGSHDVSRAAQRWGRDGARAMLLLLLALPGAVYLYAGDELGLPEVALADDEIRDPVFRRSGGTERGRDGARVPLPWTDGPAPYGFGPVGSTPWLPQPAGWGGFSVARQADDPTSALVLTRAALRLRATCWRGRPAEVTWLDAPPGCLAFRRGADGPTCLVNLGDTAIDRRPYGGSVLLASAPVDGPTLPARSAAWLD
ncbi:alpha-amylase family glycosyl hydrolase [Micromonospora sp. CPCC 205556]|uniref:alpha-amylase family glycosyl hydrolase n=1 Tax=Micromonospora sp. CPCC 205556 TaxID=3122398 RepID=UPI002FF28AA4